MADNRKPFRPRRLAFGGRLFPRGRMLGAALVVLGALGLPAQAQETGLKSGAASLSAGNFSAAVRQLSATINSQNASPAQAAKALFLRGVAYRKLGQPGKAIADLGAAIWLGLPASDRVRALVNRGLAFRAAGLSSQANAEFATARKASSSSQVEKLIAEDGGVAVASAEPGTFSTEVSSGSPSSSSSLWDRLVPSFGGGSSTPPPAPPASTPAPPPPPPAQTADTAPATGWDSSVSSDPPSQGGNRVSRWFGSITDGFGSSGPSNAQPPAPAATPAAPPPPPQPPAAAPPSAASWAANTETTKVASDNSGGGGVLGRWFSSSSDAAPAPVSGGGYQVQFANSRSEAEAKALWKQVASQNTQLASAQPQIEKVEIGSFGTFYSLRIGPFSDRESSAKVCNALKRNGTDCTVVSPDGP